MIYQEIHNSIKNNTLISWCRNWPFDALSHKFVNWNVESHIQSIMANTIILLTYSTPMSIDSYNKKSIPVYRVAHLAAFCNNSFPSDIIIWWLREDIVLASVSGNVLIKITFYNHIKQTVIEWRYIMQETAHLMGKGCKQFENPDDNILFQKRIT